MCVTVPLAGIDVDELSTATVVSVSKIPVTVIAAISIMEFFCFHLLSSPEMVSHIFIITKLGPRTYVYT